MIPDSIYPTDVKRAQKELIAHIDREIQRREEDPGRFRIQSEDAIPGDDLVASVGKLSLLTDPPLQNLCEQSLWPRVRECLGLDSPGALVWGSFDPFIQQARSLLERPALLRLAARTEAVQAVSPSQWEDDSLTLFINRLEAGFFLTGLEVLWPAEGPAAARRIWLSGRLKDLDELVCDYKDRLAPLQEDFRTLLADLPMSLSSPWFEGVRALVQQPVLSLVAMDEAGQDAAEIDPELLRTVLLEELLDREVGGKDWSVTADRDSSLLFVQNAQGDAVGVWFPITGEDRLTLEQDSAVYLRTVVCAEAVGMASPDGDDQIFLLRFGGYIPEADFIRFLQNGEDPVVFGQDAFLGDHDEALAILVRILGEEEE